MKRFIILAAALLCAVAANAQQLKTAQGITIETEPEPKPKKTLVPTERGFEQSVEVGGFYTTDDWFFIGAKYIAGYRFNKTLFVGGGTGFEFEVWDGIATIPVFANAKAYIGNWRLTPFIGLSIGGRIDLTNDLPNDHGYTIKPFGIYCDPHIGVEYTIKRYAFNLKLGWSLVNYIDYYDGETGTESGPSLNIGEKF